MVTRDERVEVVRVCGVKGGEGEEVRVCGVKGGEIEEVKEKETTTDKSSLEQSKPHPLHWR